MAQTPALNVPLQARQAESLVEIQAQPTVIPIMQGKITINIRVTKAGKFAFPGISKNEVCRR